jgi:hypothetical protein
VTSEDYLQQVVIDGPVVLAEYSPQCPVAFAA